MARVARWRFENGALTTDSQGTNTLTNVSGVTADTSVFQEGAAAASFVRASNQYFSITDANLNAGFPFKSGGSVGTMTICFWFNPATVNNGKGLVTKHASGVASFYINLANSTLQFGCGGVGNDDVFDVEAGKWYHVSVAIHAANKTRRWRVWNQTDGLLHANTADMSFTNALATTTASLMIGGISNGSSAFAFDGKMDDVQIYDTLLSAEEMDTVRIEGEALSPSAAPSAGGLTLSGQSPGLSFPTLAAGSLVLTGWEPLFLIGGAIDVGAGSLTLTGSSPTLLLGGLVSTLETTLPVFACELNALTGGVGGFALSLPALQTALASGSRFSFDLAALTADLTAATGVSSTLVLELPAFEAAVAVGSRLGFELPALEVLFGGSAGVAAGFSLNLPPFAALFEGKTVGLAQLVLNLPGLQAAFAGGSSAQASLTATFPVLEALFSGHAGPVASLALELPALEALLTTYEALTGNLVLTLPALQTLLTGAPSGRFDGVILQHSRPS